MKLPSNEELWLLCLKGKCTDVNDTGLELLLKSYHCFYKALIKICCTLAQHNSRVTIIGHDVFQSLEVMFRQREYDTIRLSGYLLNEDESMDVDTDEAYEDNTSLSQSSSSDEGSGEEEEEEDDEEEDEKEEEVGEEVGEEEKEEEKEEVGEEIQQPIAQLHRQELKKVLVIECDADIDAIENDPAQKKLLVPRILSLKSHLHMFKSFSNTAYISVEAFNALAGVCEHQVQLNLQGESSIFQVVYGGAVVPISVMMKLTKQEEEKEAVELKEKYTLVERDCLVSLTKGRQHQKELLEVLQKLLISSPIADIAPSDRSGLDQKPSTLAQLHEEESKSAVLADQLQATRKKLRLLQDVLREVNELAFSLRSLTSPPQKEALSLSQVASLSSKKASSSWLDEAKH